jgi:hypothetical protein
VDSSKRSDDDGDTSKESGLERGVLSRGSLSVVLVTDNNPRNTVLSVVAADCEANVDVRSKSQKEEKKEKEKDERSNGRDPTNVARNLIPHSVSLSVLGVDGT